MPGDVQEAVRGGEAAAPGAGGGGGAGGRVRGPARLQAQPLPRERGIHPDAALQPPAAAAAGRARRALRAQVHGARVREVPDPRGVV